MIGRQKRALFFVHDGIGLGHLSRLSKIARRLQGEFACLLVSGYNELSWLVAPECEYIHLPNLYDLLNRPSFLETDSRLGGFRPFLNFSSQDDILSFRKKQLDIIIKAFAPDAIFIDHKPLGRLKEMEDVIKNHEAKKYFVARGIMDDPARFKKDILQGRTLRALEKDFDKIFIACDEKICDFAKEYDLSGQLIDKLQYVGYIATPIMQDMIEQTRITRGMGKDDIWVVCSFGGGVLADDMINGCVKLASENKNLHFDIIAGPMSGYVHDFHIEQYNDYENVRIYKEHYKLNYLLASCDISIGFGSYNFLVESLQGNSSIIAVPGRNEINSEQYIHPRRISKYIDLAIAISPNDIRQSFNLMLNRRKNKTINNRKSILDCNGIENIRRAVLDDFGIV